MREPTHVPSSLSPDASLPPDTIGETVGPREDSALRLDTPSTRASDPCGPGSGSGVPAGLGERYEVLGEEGHGGMGAVLRGRDRVLGRELAIKVLLGHLADRPEVVQRFREEAQVGGQLQHPGVVPIYDLGLAADNKPYFTMKLVKGVTLAALLRQRSDPSQDRPRFLGIFLQVCQAVGYAHSRGVLHRDLKPSNVMVGAFGEVQVMDWGLAKVLPPPDTATAEKTVTMRAAERAAEQAAPTVVQVTRPEEGAATREGDVLGTPAYMPPEQARGELDQLDERADVFSLGAVLCAILTGQPPYADRDSAAVLRRARRADLGEAWERLDRCGAEAELPALARRCLAVNPAARPRNAGEVAREVEAYQTGVEERARQAELERAAALARAEEAQVTAREAQAREAAQRRARRLTLGLAAATLLMVVAGGGGTWIWQQHRATANAQTQLALEQGRSRLEKGWNSNNVARLEAAVTEADKALKLAQGGASAAFQQEAADLHAEAEAKLQQAKKNEELLTDLLNVANPRETKHYLREDSGTVMALAEPSLEEQFVQAFRRWDRALDFDRTPLETLVSRLREQPEAVVQRVVAGLDIWMLDRRERVASWQRLFQLAEKLDPDKGSRQLRQTLVSGELERETAIRALAWLLPGPVLVEPRLGTHTKRLREQAARAARTRTPVLRLVTLARALVQGGDVKEATQLLLTAVATQPDREVLLNDLGKLLEWRGPAHREKAIGCYRAVRALRPHLGVALGRALRQADRLAEAEEVFVDLRKRQPNTPELSFYLGLVLHDRKKLAEAEAAYRKAIELQPAYAEAYTNLGAVLHAQKKLAEAEAAYHKAIELQPNLPQAHNNLGIVLGEQKRLVEAEAACRKATVLQPNHAVGYINLGLVLSEQKRLVEAEAACRKAIALQSNLAEAYYHLGLVLCDKKKLAEAEDAFRKATALRPDDAKAYYNLGSILYQQKKPSEAEAAYLKAIELQPDHAQAYGNLGLVLHAQKKLGEAEAAFRKALALQPDYASAYSNLGVVLYAQKKLAEAEAAYGKAIALQPDYAGAYYNLGLVLRDQNKWPGAEAAFRRALAFQPNLVGGYVNLGVVLGKQKKLAEAEAAFRRADQLLPNHPTIRANLAQTKQLLALDNRLAAVQAGKAHPKDARERLDLGLFCGQYHQRYVAAVGFVADAFAAEPKLAADPTTPYRFTAVCFAALAAAGKGEDAGKLNEQKRARLRKQALDWLRADLDANAALAAKAESRSLVRQRLSFWLKDESLAGVRDDKPLATLPETERKEWRQLWTDVASLLKKVEEMR